MRETLADPTPRLGPAAAIAERARNLWEVRGLVYEFALRDVRVRYRQALLGVLWALLMPALTVGAGVVLRSVALRHAGVGASAADPVAMAAVAMKAVGWAFFAGAVGSATSTLASNAGLVGRIYFPRESLPLGVVLAQCVDLAAGIAGVVVFLVVLGLPIGPTVLWVPLLVALLVVLAGAASTALACANLFFRDVRYIVQVLLTFGVFFTPVFVDVEQLGARLARVAMLNPVAPLLEVLEGARLAVVRGHNLARPLVLDDATLVWHPAYLAYSAAWAVLGAVGVALLYARLELSFAERL
jgi:lipopolysaccharide transport system permease protein